MKKIYKSRLMITMFFVFILGIVMRDSFTLNVLLLICGPIAAVLWMYYDEARYQKDKNVHKQKQEPTLSANEVSQ
ncbi:hypothetical protein [Enterococcus faecalis]|uniref:hypothetical protein n=1 Tax=Enterococcus faecalis TaxID=1351 RepID=UPI002E35F9D8|nr:hypothetical protein [Enterococcus faecalis]